MFRNCNKVISRSTKLIWRSFSDDKNYTFEALKLKKYIKNYDIPTGSNIRNQTMSTLSDIPSVNVDDNNIKKNNIKNKSASTARNEKSNDYILGSALSPRDKNIIDIETEKVDLKAKIIALEAMISKLEVKREEVEMAMKQIESDIGSCTVQVRQNCSNYPRNYQPKKIYIIV